MFIGNTYRYNITIPMDVIYSKDDSIMRYDMMEGWKKFSIDVEFYVVLRQNAEFA